MSCFMPKKNPARFLSCAKELPEEWQCKKQKCLEGSIKEASLQVTRTSSFLPRCAVVLFSHPILLKKFFSNSSHLAEGRKGGRMAKTSFCSPSSSLIFCQEPPLATICFSSSVALKCIMCIEAF